MLQYAFVGSLRSNFNMHTRMQFHRWIYMVLVWPWSKSMQLNGSTAVYECNNMFHLWSSRVQDSLDENTCVLTAHVCDYLTYGSCIWM